MPQDVTTRVEEHPDKPWTWSMPDVRGLLNHRQEEYLDDLVQLFRLKTAHGDVIPYDMEPFQAWYHAHAPLPLGRDAPDRLVEKGRGIGYTLMTAMDILMLCKARPRITVPVAGEQGRTSTEFIDKSHDLIHDCRVDAAFGHDANVTTQIRLTNGSRIVPLPGTNPRAIRSLRAPAIVFDEFAFNDNAKELRRAGRPVMSEGGQLNVLSTHDGTDTEFFEMVEACKQGDSDMMLFTTPIHEPARLEPGRRVSDLVTNEELDVVAPWLDLSELDELWKEDPPGYRQENLCEVMDEELNLLPRRVVQEQTDPGLPLWSRALGLDDVPRLAEKNLSFPTQPDDVSGPLFLGVDFASKGHLSAYSIWEYVVDEDALYQRWVEVLQGVPTPVQLAFLVAIDDAVRLRAMLIDMTGPGTGLYETALDDNRIRAEVLGIDFGSSTKLDKRDKFGKRVKVKTKKAVCLETSRRFHDGSAWLLGDGKLADLQFRHMTSIRREDLDVSSKRDDEGHGDIFFANALAIWGPRAVTLGEWAEEDVVHLGEYEWI